MEWSKNDKTKTECCRISSPTNNAENGMTISPKTDETPAAPVSSNATSTNQTDSAENAVSSFSFDAKSSDTMLCQQSNSLSVSNNQDLLSDGELSDFSLNDSDEDDYKTAPTNSGGKLFQYTNYI